MSAPPVQKKRKMYGQSGIFLAFVQHFFDHFEGLDLELEVFDHTFLHHNLPVKHTLHECFFLVIGQLFPHLGHGRFILLHTLFVHNGSQLLISGKPDSKGCGIAKTNDILLPGFHPM
jgi:hypothetical protein